MVEKRKYTTVTLDLIAAEPETVISGNMDDEIRERMIKTIEVEGPVLEPLLYKRVINSLSLKKVGSRIEPVFRRIALSLPFSHTEEGGFLVFHNGREENFFRPSDEAERYSYQIPVSEAVKCIEYIISNEGRSLTRKELSLRFRTEMGYERMGAQVDILFSKAASSPELERYGNGRYVPKEY